MTTIPLQLTTIRVRIDAAAASVWIEPARAFFGRTRVQRPVAAFEPGDVLVAEKVDWGITFLGDRPRNLQPVLLFEGFSPEPEDGVASGEDLARLTARWDRFLGPCASITRQGDVLQGRGPVGEQPPSGTPRPRGSYRYTFGLLPQGGDPISVQRLECAHGPAAGLEPPPEPIGRSG